MASKSSSQKSLLIDLTPDEASVLSFVGSYANMPSAKPQMERLLSTPNMTPRTKAIGAAILDESRKTTPVYKYMAKRFRDAGEGNARSAKILSKMPVF